MPKPSFKSLTIYTLGDKSKTLEILENRDEKIFIRLSFPSLKPQVLSLNFMIRFIKLCLEKGHKLLEILEEYNKNTNNIESNKEAMDDEDDKDFKILITYKIKESSETFNIVEHRSGKIFVRFNFNNIKPKTLSLGFLIEYTKISIKFGNKILEILEKYSKNNDDKDRSRIFKDIGNNFNDESIKKNENIK
ncbi:MAG: hypothetical protein ACPL1F_08005, partial [bacterium]